MSPQRKLGLTPLILAAIAVALMAGPRALPRSARSTLVLAFVPFRYTALAAGKLFGGAGNAKEDEAGREYYRNKALEEHVKAANLEARLADVSGVRNVLPDPKLKLLPAFVIVNADASAWRRSVMIARGTSHGVRSGQLVLWEKHLVGRVVETGPWSSRVQLVSDPAFKTGAVTVPPEREGTAPLSARDTGVFEGAGDRAGVLKWISGEAGAEEGALVVTTEDPANGVPRGLILGRVAGAVRGRSPVPRVTVHPFVNPRALESVVVVLGVEP